MGVDFARRSRSHSQRNFGQQEVIHQQSVDARARIAADGIERTHDQRFAEEIEGGIDQHWRGSLEPEALQQIPESGIGFLADRVQAHKASREHEAFRQTPDSGANAGQRIHALAQSRAFEVARRIFDGHGHREGAEPLAVLDEVVEILFDVRCPRRSQHAAIAERARAKLGCTLEPADDFAAEQELHCLIRLPLAHDLEREARLAIVEHVLDLVARVTRPPVGIGFVLFSRHLLLVMEQIKGGAEGCSRVSGGRRHEHMIAA